MNAYFGLCLCTILLVKRKFQVACSHGQQDSAAEHKLDLLALFWSQTAFLQYCPPTEMSEQLLLKES